MEISGFEPEASRMQSERSTAELYPQSRHPNKNYSLYWDTWKDKVFLPLLLSSNWSLTKTSDLSRINLSLAAWRQRRNIRYS